MTSTALQYRLLANDSDGELEDGGGPWSTELRCKVDATRRVRIQRPGTAETGYASPDHASCLARAHRSLLQALKHHPKAEGERTS